MPSCLEVAYPEFFAASCTPPPFQVLLPVTGIKVHLKQKGGGKKKKGQRRRQDRKKVFCPQQRMRKSVLILESPVSHV